MSSPNLPPQAFQKASSFTDLVRYFADVRWNDIPIEQQQSKAPKRSAEDALLSVSGSQDSVPTSYKRLRLSHADDFEQYVPPMSTNNSGRLGEPCKSPTKKQRALNYLDEKRRSLVAVYVRCFFVLICFLGR